MDCADDRPVFVLGCTYRTGSTFLQRLIISSGEVFVWGENMGIIDDLRGVVAKLSSWRTLSQGQSDDFCGNRTRAWIANLNPEVPDAALIATRMFLSSYYREATRELGFSRWGFKEVRYGADCARFLLELYPRARVILLVRRPRDVLASMVTSAWYSHVGGAAGVLQAWRTGVKGFVDVRDERALLVRLEDFAHAPARSLRRLGDHLEIDASGFDASLLSARVRGSTSAPRLGVDEERALFDADLDSLLKQLDYAP